MTIENIRYWNPLEQESLGTNKENRHTSDLKFPQSFDSTLFDILGGSSFNSSSLYTNDFFGNDLNSPDGLLRARQEAKDMGMEKVLAAQLSSPLPFSNMSYGNKDKNENSLGSFIDLTVQLEVAKARKVIDRLRDSESLSIQEYINRLDTQDEPEIDNSLSTESKEIADYSIALDDLRQQIGAISEQFDIPFTNVIKNIDLDR